MSRQVTMRFVVAALALALATAAGAQSTLSPDQRADALLKRMSTDDMLSLVRSYDTMTVFTPMAGSIGTAGYIPANPRLGIPAFQANDAGMGVHNYPTTLRADGQPNHVRGDNNMATPLPSLLGVAATFNPQLAFDGGRMIGGEAHAQGINVLLAGNVNLTRDPRTGRNFEYWGEDPWLASQMDAAAIRGIQSQHVISTIKHYAMNDQETHRTTVDAVIDEAAMRESDLLAFELAIEAGHPGSVMCGYNKVNGVWDCSNAHLLNDVLKGDWHYPGFVMTDWGGDHGWQDALAGTDQVSGVNHNNNLSLGTQFDSFGKPLRDAIAADKVPKSRLEDMARRILRSMYAVGLFDYPPVIKPLDVNADAEVSRKAAEQALVLLKNTHDTLPLAAPKRIAIIGGHADKGVLSGGGSGEVWPIGGPAIPAVKGGPWQWIVYDPSSPMKALQQRLPNTEFVYDDGTDPKRAAEVAKHADVAIVFAVQWLAEDMDVPNIDLPYGQDRLIDAVAAANKHNVVVLETGGPVTMPWLDKTSAVVEAWYPGARGGEAIADVLTGKTDPSGRLPITFPQSLAQLPRPQIPQGASIDYNIEGAAVGYKWFDKKQLSPLFPFGFGLSYTQFGYSDLGVRNVDGKLQVSFRVTNTGKRAGLDAPQVYVSLPDGGEAPRRLAGFQKVSLQPGQSETVNVQIDPRLLARFDASARQWKIAAGSYPVAVGHSSRDLVLHAKADVAAASMAP